MRKKRDVTLLDGADTDKNVNISGNNTKANPKVVGDRQVCSSLYTFISLRDHMYTKVRCELILAFIMNYRLKGSYLQQTRKSQKMGLMLLAPIDPSGMQQTVIMFCLFLHRALLLFLLRLIPFCVKVFTTP